MRILVTAHGKAALKLVTLLQNVPGVEAVEIRDDPAASATCTNQDNTCEPDHCRCQ
jgi:hypothetical protein